MLELETILAKASMDRVSLRDPNKTYHMMSRQEVAQLAPNFAWDQYFQATGAPAFQTLNVSQPDYIKQIAVDLANSSIDSWRAYFTYHLLRSARRHLPEAFENEAFDFWNRYLTGAKEQRPRTARCVATVDRELGDLLGQKYIELTFGADAKAQITQLVDALEKAMARGHTHLALDDRRDQEGRARQVESHHQQCRLSQEVARVRQAHHRP